MQSALARVDVKKWSRLPEELKFRLEELVDSVVASIDAPNRWAAGFNSMSPTILAMELSYNLSNHKEINALDVLHDVDHRLVSNYLEAVREGRQGPAQEELLITRLAKANTYSRKLFRYWKTQHGYSTSYTYEAPGCGARGGMLEIRSVVSEDEDAVDESGAQACLSTPYVLRMALDQRAPFECPYCLCCVLAGMQKRNLGGKTS